MRTLIAAIVVAAFIAGVAHACPPPPPPPPQMEGESVEAYEVRLAALRAEQVATLQAWRADYQQRWWNESESVLLARVERTATVDLSFYPNGPRVYLRPVRWLKGSGPSRRFHLNYMGMTSCGPIGGGEAVTGAVGDRFVVFVREGQPGLRSLIASVALANIVDPQLRERLEQTD